MDAIDRHAVRVYNVHVSVLLDIGGSTLRQPPEETYKRNGFGCFDQSEERFLLMKGPQS